MTLDISFLGDVGSSSWEASTQRLYRRLVASRRFPVCWDR